MRKTGILLAVSSLPSNFGIGDFGPSCYQFLDDCKLAGVKIWQILPLNPLGYGNSPYQPYSSFAIDEIYLSLELLEKEGLLKKIKPFHAKSRQVDYPAVREYKLRYLWEAFFNFKENKKYKQFIQQDWVYSYAVFRTLKKINENRPWIEWPEEHKNWIKDQKADLSQHEEMIRFEMFVQFKCFEQWMAVKKYANKKGIECIGDLPIYVGLDSEDVWSHQSSFLLDDDGRPIFIAGVPPDYFSETGQRWGNPIYNWEELEKNDFDFWVERLSYNSKLYDAIRIDHFRAFDTYWKIPASCPTAIEGEWVEAPGYHLFDTLYERIDHLNIIAEDLGDMRPEVYVLRDHYHLPGMKITEFTFDVDQEAESRENMIVYTGTHDNQTLKGWLHDQSSQMRRKMKKFFAHSKQETLTYCFLEYVLEDIAETAILPMQDILELDDRARMNVPGTIGSPNWEWKMTDFKEFEKRIPHLRKMIRRAKR